MSPKIAQLSKCVAIIHHELNTFLLLKYKAVSSNNVVENIIKYFLGIISNNKLQEM